MLVNLLFFGLGILFFLTALFVIVKMGALILLQPRRITPTDYSEWTEILSPEDVNLPYDALTVNSKDGTPILGWFIRNGNAGKGTVIYLHGLADSRISGLPLAKLFHERGYHVFLFDSRRHGDSGGKFCTYGYYEKWDVESILTKLQDTYGSTLGRFGLFGTSMGAAVALQAAEIDKRIVAVVAESSFTDLRTIGLDYQKRIIKVRWKFISDLVMSRSERLARFVADEVSPLRALDSVSVPILFVHGTNDRFIHPRYSEMLFKRAHDPKELYLIKDAFHNDTRIIGGREYEMKLLEFFDRWLASRGSTNNSPSTGKRFSTAP